MHKKLKIKFTLLSTALTGLVLMAACLFAYSSAKIETKVKYDDSFEYQSQTLSVFLAGTRRLEYRQFYRMEQESGMYIYFYDGGTPLYFADTYTENSKEVFDAFYIKLQEEFPQTDLTGSNGNEPVSHKLEFSYENEDFIGKYVSAPANSRQWYSFFLMRPMTEQKAEIKQLGYTYALIFAVGLLVLLVISWLLARLAVKPVEKAHKEQIDFIAAASHELKSPLAVIMASADYAKHAPEITGQSLDKIIRESKRMSSLVDDLLLLHGTETGRWKIQKEAVDTENILLEVYENFLPLSYNKNQKLTLHIPEDGLPALWADEYRMIQLISIFVSNALSYSPENTEIAIMAKAARRDVQIQIIDHGAGIADNEKKDIFKKFYRTDKSHKEKNHFGLGLSVAKELANLHSADIKISDTAGGGATFILVFPTGK